jgi:hypothetical protein
MQPAKVEVNGEALYLKTENLTLGAKTFEALGLSPPLKSVVMNG